MPLDMWVKMKQRREISRIETTAITYGNSAKILVPRGWLGRRVIAQLKSDLDEEGTK